MKRWFSVLLGVALVAPLHSALAVEAFVGRWAISAAVCNGSGTTAATAPLIASDTAVRWHAGPCRIHKMYKLGQVIYVQARCFGDSTKDVPVTLDARGDRMKVTWAGAKPEELRRCK